MTDVLERFSPATRAWFRGSFPAPTTAQAGAWDAISTGRNALVVAPTGSGKTLSAFLWALDRLATEQPPEEQLRRCRVLYVSPMKALAVDVERNLRSPLVGIGHAARRLGLPVPETTVAVRSGDTPANERRTFARTPSDILITTPESLFLLLTSQAREALRGVETVIVDEIHALAGTKRGAHLALSLERLDALLPQPAQRIGLSATVRPVEEVARYLAGGRPVDVVQPESTKEWDLDVVVPVADMADLAAPNAASDDPAKVNRASIWPHVEERIVDLVEAHRSTIVFANSRRLAERLTSRLNEIHEERVGEGATVLARAHHGSVSKEQRQSIEEDLKAGRLPAVVATSSLELGIDMGAVDLVIQVESPPSVASGLQRVGRAGHQVGAVSRGVLFPKFRGDLVQTAVVVERMRAGEIEALHVPANPLDVLAQQIVAMCALDDWTVAELGALVRRASPFAGLGPAVLESVLDMLSGRYPSDEFAELRPRILWDRLGDTLAGRPGAQRLAVTSGGTIPDRGLFGVFIAADGPGRRVGELDEEMVYESRVGDVFTLGTSTWRIEDITHDQVLVTPAPGQPGRLPFWKGDQLGRPAELGAAVGAFVREVAALPPARATARVRAAGLDEWAADNLLTYLSEQRQATGHLPDDRTIVLERFRDELGDWRIAVHSPFGAQLHAPWALCVTARMRERFGVDVQAMHGDDGMVFRLPDLEFDDGATIGAELLGLVTLEADEVHDLVTREIGGSALFAARFRECAARALLLPRRRPDRRQPLWQQRQRSAQLLEVASGHPTFPIVLEAVRECVQDVFDVPGLTALMSAVASREVTVVEVETPQPSPFARSLLFGYVAQFLYEGDSPLAEKRAAALTLDPALLAELLGRGEGLSLRELLDPDTIVRTEAELQRLLPDRGCRNGEDVADLLRVLGPLSRADLAARAPGYTARDVESWLADLVAARRIVTVRIAGQERLAAVEDAARLRDALGVSLPMGLPATFLEPVADPLGDLVARYARAHAPFTLHAVATWWGVGPAVAHEALRRLAASGRVVEGEFLPDGSGGALEFCDAEVLRRIRRRSLAALRSEVEPVEPVEYARFLARWQSVGSPSGTGPTLRGVDGVVRAVEQLSGAVLPASAIERLILPARVRDYQPAMLDELTSAGEVLWQGHGSLPGDDGWISLHLAEGADLTLHPPKGDVPAEGLRAAVASALAGGGAYFFRGLVDVVSGRPLGEVEAAGDAHTASDADVLDALWDLVWKGRLAGDTFAPVRGMLAGGRAAHQRPAQAPRARRSGSRRHALGGFGGLDGQRPARPAMPLRSGPPAAAGRWSLLPDPESDPTLRTHASAELLLDRHGIVTRGSVAAEEIEGGFAAIYRVLAAAEESGRVRRGYFVESLGASQFGTTGAVDRLRGGDATRSASVEDARGAEGLVLAACDPANPYGAAVPWPARVDPTPDGGRGHRAGRKAGALVVLVDGALVLYVERGGRTILTWDPSAEALAASARALAETVRSGRLSGLTVHTIDGQSALSSDHPLSAALLDAGFHATPRGLRLRR
ncbi:DEAD/DEAH box helicase [Janibacter sp. G56]|uniref:DEAD/DEAH box helicase n=1 Tax=Janibacter sp. G56 TaxID=3418717 RepID=UPI003D037C91